MKSPAFSRIMKTVLSHPDAKAAQRRAAKQTGNYRFEKIRRAERARQQWARSREMMLGALRRRRANTLRLRITF